jgi:signal peptide peptidase SppA
LKYSRASQLFYNVPLAMLPSKITEIRGFWESKLAGETLEWEDRAETFAVQHVDIGDMVDDLPEGDSAAPQKRGSIAVIPLHGSISQRMNMFTAMSGGTSTEMFGQVLRDQLNDPKVRAIVIDIDSPGGSSYGVTELANQIMNARGQKPMLGAINSVGASAAYWIASALDQVFVTPGGIAGSIGVYAVHQDISQLEANEGVKTTLISAGEHKTRGNPHEPLSEDDKAHIQVLVDDTYNRFIRDVARGRGTSLKNVRDNYGKGDVFTSEQAKATGMVDDIKTLDEVISAAATARPRRIASGLRSELEEDLDVSADADEDGRQMLRLQGWRHQQAQDALLAPIRGG